MTTSRSDALLAAETDWLRLAEATLPEGFNHGDAASMAATEALIGIGFELRRLVDALTAPGSGMNVAEIIAAAGGIQA